MVEEREFEVIGVMDMEKYHYILQRGLLLLLCIMMVYSNWGIYIDYRKSKKEPDIIKKRKHLSIASSVILVILVIWFIYEIIHLI